MGIFAIHAISGFIVMMSGFNLSPIRSIRTISVFLRLILLRLIFILSGGLAGLFGLAVCFSVLVANVCAMNDFSVSYLSPAAPFYPSGIKDIVYMKSFREYEKSRPTLSDIREAADE